MLIPLFAIFLWSGGGCGEEPSNTARFEVDGLRSFEGCLERAFPLEPELFEVRRRIDSLGVIMASRFQFEFDADLVWIEVFRPREVRDRLGRAIPLDPDLGPQPTADRVARAELELRESCPDLNESLVIRGRLIFEDLPENPEGRVTGRLEDASIISARTGDVAADTLSGEWQFTGSDRAPFSTFEEDEYRREP